MKLYEYMKERNGLASNGGIKFAMSKAEFENFNIIENKGWARKYSDFELDNNVCNELLSIYSKFKEVPLLNKYIYLIHSQVTEKSKIGISSDPKNRKNSIQTVSGMPLDLISVWEVKHVAREVEKSLHASFKNIRNIGEWFDGLLTASDIEKYMPCEYRRVVGRSQP